MYSFFSSYFITRTSMITKSGRVIIGFLNHAQSWLRVHRIVMWRICRMSVSSRKHVADTPSTSRQNVEPYLVPRLGEQQGATRQRQVMNILRLVRIEKLLRRRCPVQFQRLPLDCEHIDMALSRPTCWFDPTEEEYQIRHEP